MPAAPHIVIAGGGFGGFHVAETLARRLPPGRARVTLLNDGNASLYTPFMAGVAGGALEPRHIMVPLRESLPGTEVRVLRIESADPAAQRLRVRNPAGREEELPYDRLVVALGSVTRAVAVPGLVEHGMGFKTLAEAVALRDRLLRTLELAETLEDPAERAPHLTFMFVGGGYAGLGGMAELQDFAQDIVRLYPRCRQQGLRFVLVESRDRVLAEIPESLATFALRELTARGIEVRSGTRVTAITADDAELSTGERIPTRMVVWTAGVRPSPVIAHLGLPLDEGGRIRVDAHMRVEGRPDVWALGDAAAVPDPSRPGLACPPTRQHAMRQAWRLGENLAAEAGGGAPEPFSYRTRGVFVDLGRSRAVALFMGVRLRGLPAWLLTRYYHVKRFPGWGRKVQLLSDWATDRAFARDSSELGQVGHPIDRPGPPDTGRANPARPPESAITDGRDADRRPVQDLVQPRPEGPPPGGRRRPAR